MPHSHGCHKDQAEDQAGESNSPSTGYSSFRRSSKLGPVLDFVHPGPPIVTFPHQKVEAFFEVSIAHASNKEGVGYGSHR